MDRNDLDGVPAPDSVSSRAEGRPPSEQTSDDPQEQARVILEESETRIAAGAAKSQNGSDRGTRLCGVTLVRGDGTEAACTLVEGHPGAHQGIPALLTPDG